MKKYIYLLLIASISLNVSSFTVFKNTKGFFLNNDRTTLNEQTPLKGNTFKRTTWGLYTTFEFVGQSTVIVHSLKMEFTTTYKRDGKLIRIGDGKSGVLLLEMKDKSTLIGRGVSKGIYKKQY